MPTTLAVRRRTHPSVLLVSFRLTSRIEYTVKLVHGADAQKTNKYLTLSHCWGIHFGMDELH